MPRNRIKAAAGASGRTPERRERQRIAIHGWAPWTKGAIKKGDTRGRLNALKHGARSADMRELDAALNRIGRALAALDSEEISLTV
jgi:hypothetical protein